MSLADEVIGPTIRIPSRERQINNAVTEAAARAGLAMILEVGGIEQFGVALEEQKEAVRANFLDVTRRVLQRFGVLDGEGNIIPGQESHAQRHGFYKER